MKDLSLLSRLERAAARDRRIAAKISRLRSMGRKTLGESGESGHRRYLALAQEIIELMQSQAQMLDGLTPEQRSAIARKAGKAGGRGRKKAGQQK